MGSTTPTVNLPFCQYAQISCSTKQHADELETLLTIQQAITSRLDLSDVLQLIAEEAQRLTSAQLSLLYVLEGNDLRLAAVSGRQHADELIGYRIPVAESIAGLSIQTSQPIVLTDVQSDDERIYLEAIEHFGNIHCYMTVPLISGIGPIGVIAVADQDTALLRADSLRVLSMLAPSAVIGLENARLYKEQQERRLEAEGRHQMAESLRVMLTILNSDRSLDEIMDYIVTHVSNRLLDCQAMAIFSLQPKDGILAIEAVHGLPENLLAAGKCMPGFSALHQSVQTCQPVAVADAASRPKDEPCLGLTAEEKTLVSQLETTFLAWLAVPLIIKGEVYGAILAYYQQPHHFSEEEIGLAQAFSDQVALAIENARLRMQAEQAAVIAERNRLARELHDSVSQTLFSTSLIAEVIPRLWQRNQAEGQQRLEELGQLTRGALAEMRTLLFELRPAVFKEANLGDLLKLLTQAIAVRTRIPITLDVDGERVLSPDVKFALYRIAQESLNNVTKYANPGLISVCYCCKPDQVELSISDDGCGFDPESISAGHLGIKIMHERAASINATLNLKSNPGCGTKIEVIWPEPILEERS